MSSKTLTYSERRNRVMSRILVLPGTIWLLLFFVLPLLVVVGYSFLTPSSRFQVALPITVDNYVKVADDTYTSILIRSVGTALTTTIICALIGYPMAYFIATRPKQWRNFFLMLVVIPFWTNFVVRTYAIAFMMNENGLINSLVVDYLKLTDTPLQLMFTPIAVYTGLVYGYLPFMILPMYTSIEKFNFRLMEAAADLGANDLRAFLRVMIPATMPGIAAGCVLVFIPALGAYVTSDMLGGAKFLMIGNQVKALVDSATGKPLGSALSITMMGVVIAALLVYYRFTDRDTRRSAA